MTTGKALLVDFGSTYTKIRAIDTDSGQLIASAQAPSTVDSDVTIGLRDALDRLEAMAPTEDFSAYRKLASSSAGGGLKIAAVGLIHDLTAEAAKRAALGAGGKVVAVFSNGLTSSDVAELERIAPDVIVLGGGTDGGNETCILQNSEAIARSTLDAMVIVAGNRNAADKVSSILESGQKRHEVVANVLPELHRLNTTECTDAIRRAFMGRIVWAKGLERAQAFVEDIVMPTPQAVLLGCSLVARGTAAVVGFGDHVCVDVGGATTDVYSISDGAPADTGTVVLGLPEERAKRTVEGDLGLRANAASLVELQGESDLAGDFAFNGFDPALAAAALTRHPEFIPDSEESRRFDVALARKATQIALTRHAGELETVFSPDGMILVQRGKDLRGVGALIGTGGIFAAGQSSDVHQILSASANRINTSRHLVPESAVPYVDRDYVLFAAGLLSEIAPDAACEVAKTSLQAVDLEA